MFLRMVTPADHDLALAGGHISDAAACGRLHDRPVRACTRGLASGEEPLHLPYSSERVHISEVCLEPCLTTSTVRVYLHGLSCRSAISWSSWVRLGFTTSLQDMGTPSVSTRCACGGVVPGVPCLGPMLKQHSLGSQTQTRSAPAPSSAEPPISAVQSEDEVMQINKHILALLYRTLRFKMQHDDSLRVSSRNMSVWGDATLLSQLLLMRDAK